MNTLRYAAHSTLDLVSQREKINTNDSQADGAFMDPIILLYVYSHFVWLAVTSAKEDIEDREFISSEAGEAMGSIAELLLGYWKISGTNNLQLGPLKTDTQSNSKDLMKDS